MLSFSPSTGASGLAKFTASATVTRRARAHTPVGARVCPSVHAHHLARFREKKLCSPERENHSPGVELVDDAFEADDSEEPGAEPGQPGQEEDGERQQGLPPGRLRQAAGQTSCCPAVAASLRRRAAAPVARVGRSGVQRRFLFAVGNRVMLRHVLRQSRRGQRAKRAISLSRRKGKSAPSFSLPRSTSETDGITFPCAAPHPLNTCFLSKLPNFTSHRVQSQLNNPRKSHSSGALQHTGSDTCGWSSSSFLGAGSRGRGLLAEPLRVRQVRPVGNRLAEGTNHEAGRL